MSRHDEAQALPIRLRVNGASRQGRAEPRMNLADFLRGELGMTGTHVGCEHGVCGACTVLVDGCSGARLPDAGGAGRGREIGTVEGLARPDGSLHPIQQAFHELHGLQCGFCTPGILMSVAELLAMNRIRTRRGSVTCCPVTCAVAPATRTSWTRCCWRRGGCAGWRMSGHGPVEPARPAGWGRHAPDRGCGPAAGEARFLDDIPVATPLHACFVRSPHAHARIVSIDLSAARAMPGVTPPTQRRISMAS